MRLLPLSRAIIAFGTDFASLALMVGVYRTIAGDNSPCDQQAAHTQFSEIVIESTSVGKGGRDPLCFGPTVTLYTAILQPKNRLRIQVNYAGAALARQADHVFGSAGAITGFAIPECDHSEMLRRSTTQSLTEEP
jgi:hypothetical protein